VAGRALRGALLAGAEADPPPVRATLATRPGRRRLVLDGDGRIGVQDRSALQEAVAGAAYGLLVQARVVRARVLAAAQGGGACRGATALVTRAVRVTSGAGSGSP